MNQLTVTMTAQRPLRPLVEAALNNELRMLEAAIQRTEGRLKQYEVAHGMSSAQFLQRYENDELAETLDFAEWIGELRLLTRLREKAAGYREIELVHEDRPSHDKKLNLPTYQHYDHAMNGPNCIG
jgi:hypothetical protein